jgi:hypothetical protein
MLQLGAYLLDNLAFLEQECSHNALPNNAMREAATVNTIDRLLTLGHALV